MTPTAESTKSARTPMTAEAVRRMLRDAAFILHMTRRVKEQILAGRPEAAGEENTSKNPELAAGLGV